MEWSQTGGSADEGRPERWAGEGEGRSVSLSATAPIQYPGPGESHRQEGHWPRSALEAMTDSLPAQLVWNSPWPGAGGAGVGLGGSVGKGGVELEGDYPNIGYPNSNCDDPHPNGVHLQDRTLVGPPGHSPTAVESLSQPQLWPSTNLYQSTSTQNASTPIPSHTHTFVSPSTGTGHSTPRPSLPWPSSQPVFHHLPQLHYHNLLPPPLPLFDPQSFPSTSHASQPIAHPLHSFLGRPEMPDLFTTPPLPVAHESQLPSRPRPALGPDPLPVALPDRAQPAGPPISRPPCASQPLLKAQHAHKHPWHLDSLQIPSHPAHAHRSPTEHRYSAHNQLLSPHNTHFRPDLMAGPSVRVAQPAYQLVPNHLNSLDHAQNAAHHLQPNSHSHAPGPERGRLVPVHCINSAHGRSDAPIPATERFLMGPPVSASTYPAHQTATVPPQPVDHTQMTVSSHHLHSATDQGRRGSQVPQPTTEQGMMGPPLSTATHPAHQMCTTQPPQPDDNSRLVVFSEHLHSATQQGRRGSEVHKPAAEHGLIEPLVSSTMNPAHQIGTAQPPQPIDDAKMAVSSEHFHAATEQDLGGFELPKPGTDPSLIAPPMSATNPAHINAEPPKAVSSQPLPDFDRPPMAAPRPDHPTLPATDRACQMLVDEPRRSTLAHTPTDPPARLAPEHAQPASAPPPDLPPSITLLHLAHIHLHAARQLVTLFMPRPSAHYASLGTLHYQPPAADAGAIAHALATYRRHVSAALAALRATVYLDGAPAEHALAAICLLVTLLLAETRPSAEPAALVRHGLAIARQRDSLKPYRLVLAELQVRVDSADPDVPFRQIKKQLERASELTTRNGAVDGRYADWHYRFHLLHAHLSHDRASDVPAALARLRHLAALADARGDGALWAVAAVQEAKVLLERAQWARAGELLATVVKRVELPDEPAPGGAMPAESAPGGALPGVPAPDSAARVPVPRLLRTHIMLLLCVQLVAVGECVRAKFWLRLVRQAMDDADGQEEGEREGTFTVSLQNMTPHHRPRPLGQMTPVKTSSGVLSATDWPLSKLGAVEDTHAKPQTVTIAGMPHELVYTLTYVVGMAVHLDGHGKAALLYVSEGLKQIDRQLTCGLRSLGESESVATKTGLGAVGWLRRATGVGLGMKIEASLMAVQLAIVRSEFGRADEMLVEVMKLVRAEGRWERDWARIAFLKAMLSHATGNLSGARRALLATLIGAPAGELGVLAKACYVLVRLADEEHSGIEDGAQAVVRMDRVTREVEEAVGQALPHENMACQVVLAMSCGEIVRAKHHLTVALNEANKTCNTHLKTILLGLLSNLFLNTRSQEAFKMLHSCFKLAVGFGSGKSGGGGGGGGGSGSGGFGSKVEVATGQASLGLWAGKKLLEIYESQEGCESKAFKQSIINKLHLNLLEEIQPL